MIDFSKLNFDYGGADPVDYWSGQELSPWKETGYGGGKVGIGKWTQAGQPLPVGYPDARTPYGDDMVPTEIPSQFNYPEMPEGLRTALEGAAPQDAIRRLWENYYSRSQYENPEWASFLQENPDAPARPYTTWGDGLDPVARHMREVLGWGEEDIQKVTGAWKGDDDGDDGQNWFYDFDYRGADPVDYWTERHGLHPWQELGFGQLGQGGFAAWQEAGMPIPSGYPRDWKDKGPTPPGPTPPDVPPVPPFAPPGPPTPPVDLPPWEPPTFDYPPAGEGAPDTITGGYPPEPPPFPYPSQWGEAGNIFSKFAEGMPTPLPPTWEFGEDIAAQIAETGLPTPIPQLWKESAGLARGIAETGLETPVPEAWGQAEKLAGEMGETGFRTPTPDIWGDVKGFGRGMMETGMPISSEDWYQQARTVAEMDIKDAIDMAKEQFGVAGLRASSPLYRTAGDISTRRMAELGTEFAGRQTAALEAARGRQMGAAEQLFGVGMGEAGLGEAAAGRRAGAIPQLTDIGGQRAALTEAAAGRKASMVPMLGELGSLEAGLGEAAAGRKLGALPSLLQFGAGEAALGESAKDRAMGAAQNLVGLGGQYFQAPLTVADYSMRAGESLQRQQQSAIAPFLQEFLRMTPELSPWLQYATGLTTMPFQMQPQQYQPSFFSQLLGMGSGLGMAALMGGG